LEQARKHQTALLLLVLLLWHQEVGMVLLRVVGTVSGGAVSAAAERA
jgi:hypothetical protein